MIPDRKTFALQLAMRQILSGDLIVLMCGCVRYSV